MNFSIAEYSAMLYNMIMGMSYGHTLLNKGMDRNHKKGNVFHCEEDVSSAEIEKHKRWLREFWQQMPLESQRKKYKDLFKIDLTMEKCDLEREEE